MPFLLKDLACHSAGDPMYEGSKFLREVGWVEQEDTVLAARFRAAGFVFLGKTNTPEFGILPTTETEAFGPARNPWDTGRSTGGSSGGSAAAVAAGIVAAAHGNDGGGSIRIPASHCGLVGLKPSRGRISLGPDYGDVMVGLVNEGVLTRSVRDTAAILDAVHGHDARRPVHGAAAPRGPLLGEVGDRARPPGCGSRCGPRRPAASTRRTPTASRRRRSPGGCSSRSATASRRSSCRARRRRSDRDVPRAVERRRGWVLDYWSRSTGRAITPDDVEPLTWALAEMGRSVTGPDLLSAVEQHQVLGWRLAAWQQQAGFDLLLTPTTAEPAAAARLVRAPARPAAPPDRPRDPVRGVHRRSQHDRRARDLAPAALERRRHAGRRPARRALRPRGRPHPRRRPARRGGAMGGDERRGLL